MKLGSPEAMRQEPHDFYKFEEREAEKEAAEHAQELEKEEEEYEAARIASMQEALGEYAAHKAQKMLEAYQEECPHDEHDHGICLDCGKDIFDDIVGRADIYRDSLND
jgi:hypothetical protein